MIRVFTGYDAREAPGWHAFAQSLIDTSSQYVLMPPLSGAQGNGTNTFTYERFSVPEKCNWSGPAIFVDASDMCLLAPIEELADLFDPRFAVQVVKHDYRTKHQWKYVGTEMEAPNEDYPRKNWSSVILWNCGHPMNFSAREALRGREGQYLHRFGWLKNEEIGDLPIEWNWLADEYGENPEAKLLHWTAGIPGFQEYRDSPHAADWREKSAKCSPARWQYDESVL